MVFVRPILLLLLSNWLVMIFAGIHIAMDHGLLTLKKHSSVAVPFSPHSLKVFPGAEEGFKTSLVSEFFPALTRVVVTCCTYQSDQFS
jgi:hypothetical protein